MQQASQIFQRVVLPHTHKFGPQRARAIYVAAAKSNIIKGVDVAAAAGVMGHNTKMWVRVYDREVIPRGVATNMAALATWRQEVLAKHGQVLGAAAAGPSGVAAAVAGEAMNYT